MDYRLTNPVNARSVDSPVGVRRIDSMRRYDIPRPTRIAGKVIRRFPAQNSPYKTIHCAVCALPSLWFDKRIRHQFNECVHCGTPHEMLVKDHIVKKRGIDRIPAGYNQPIPLR
jgi:hypothetical protein